MADTDRDDYLLLDDFSENTSAIDTLWEGFTDQVMGGVSEQTVVRARENDDFHIRMTGDVSLENNGGFIQIRLKLAGPFRVFDASEYKGVRLRIRGKGTGYYIFLRTSSTILPWKFYKSQIPMEEDWVTVSLSWETFTKGDYGSLGKFDPSKLKSIALVAYGEAFKAEVDLTEIGLYK